MLLHSLKCPCDREASTSAFIYGHLEIVSWLAQQGCASPQQCLHGAYPVSSPTLAQVTQGGRCLKLPAQQLLGQSLSDSSTAALKSSYRNEVFAKECFLPEHLQQLPLQRAAAIARALNTNFIDAFLMQLLARLKPWEAAPQLMLQVSRSIIRSRFIEAMQWLLDNASCSEAHSLRDWHTKICIEAASAGQIGMLEMLKARNLLGVPCDIASGQQKVLMAMLQQGPDAASIQWLHKQCPASFTTSTDLQSAISGCCNNCGPYSRRAPGIHCSLIQHCNKVRHRRWHGSSTRTRPAP